VCTQAYFGKWGDEGVVDLAATFSEVIILTASRTLLGAVWLMALPLPWWPSSNGRFLLTSSEVNGIQTGVWEPAQRRSGWLIRGCTHGWPGREVRESMFHQVADLFHDLDMGMLPISVLLPYLPIPAHWRRDRHAFFGLRPCAPAPRVPPRACMHACRRRPG
jgi:hypothetical protein